MPATYKTTAYADGWEAQIMAGNLKMCNAQGIAYEFKAAFMQQWENCRKLNYSEAKISIQIIVGLEGGHEGQLMQYSG